MAVAGCSGSGRSALLGIMLLAAFVGPGGPGPGHRGGGAGRGETGAARGDTRVAGLGVHFALPPADAERLAGLDAEEVAAFVEELEETGPPGPPPGRGWQADTDRAWDALHRCLTGGHGGDPGTVGTEPGTDTGGRRAAARDGGPEGGPGPLAYAVLGGHPLTCGETGLLVRLVTPGQVRETAAALAGLDEEWLRERFAALGLTAGPGTAGAADETGLRYTLDALREVRGLYARAAGAGRAVIFTVAA
jgi:hypothetical protein